jgi:thiamine-phosphate pyrophosphorylase
VIPRLFYITDSQRGSGGRDLREVVEQAQRGGVDAVIVRERALSSAALGELLLQLTPLRSSGLRVLVSRRCDMVRAFELDGVQLARDAVSVATARTWLGPDCTIGYSAHTAPEARQAARDGADYVTLSPIFATGSKPGAPGQGLAWLREALVGLQIPALALGGVTAERTREILGAGAWGVAAVSAIGAACDIRGAAAEFRRAITEYTK